MVMYTPLFKMDNQQGIPLSVILQPRWEGSLGEMDSCICIAESLCCLPETITMLFVNWLFFNTK